MSTYEYLTILRVTSEDPCNDNTEIGDEFLEPGKIPDGDSYQVMAGEDHGRDIVTVHQETVAVIELPKRMSEDDAVRWAQEQFEMGGKDAILQHEVSA